METSEVTNALQNCAEKNDCHGCPEDLGVESCTWNQNFGKCLFAIAAEIIRRRKTEYDDAIFAIDALDASNDSLLKENEMLSKVIRDLSRKIAYWQREHTVAQLGELIAEESIPKWTSVADGLPKQDGFYEVCVKEQYAEARRFGRKLKVIRIYEYRPCGEGEHLWTGEDFANENLWVGEDGSYVPNSVVTHWRPCPELPENEREEKQ